MDLLILAGIVAGFYLLMAINRRIYRRGHLGNLGRETDYVRKGYRGMYIHDKQPSPLQLSASFRRRPVGMPRAVDIFWWASHKSMLSAQSDNNEKEAFGAP